MEIRDWSTTFFFFRFIPCLEDLKQRRDKCHEGLMRRGTGVVMETASDGQWLSGLLSGIPELVTVTSRLCFHGVMDQETVC